jgi:hypothetical protein
MHSRDGPWAVSRIETSRKDFSGRRGGGNADAFLGRGQEEDLGGRRVGGFWFQPAARGRGGLYRLWGGRGGSYAYKVYDM